MPARASRLLSRDFWLWGGEGGGGKGSGGRDQGGMEISRLESLEGNVGGTCQVLLDNYYLKMRFCTQSLSYLASTSTTKCSNKAIRKRKKMQLEPLMTGYTINSFTV